MATNRKTPLRRKTVRIRKTFFQTFSIKIPVHEYKTSFVLLFEFAELKDAKEPSPVNKNDLSLDHHQQNGNIKTALSLLPDMIEKNSEIGTAQKLPADDGDKAINICIDIESKANEIEIANPEENVTPASVAVGESNKEAEDKYEHSLWKWPTGRSWLTKVIKVIQYVIFSNVIFCILIVSVNFRVHG